MNLITTYRIWRKYKICTPIEYRDNVQEIVYDLCYLVIRERVQKEGAEIYIRKLRHAIKTGKLNDSYRCEARIITAQSIDNVNNIPLSITGSKSGTSYY